MTEQQQNIKNNLISLVKKGVRVGFMTNCDRCTNSDRLVKSGVNIRDNEYTNRTVLTLSKEDSLDEWEAAIQEAEHAEAQRVLEREHEHNSPNFYKAISSFIGDMQSL